MFKMLAELYSLLNKKQRRTFIRLQFLVIAMAIFEVLGVMSIGPFMGLVADPNQIETSPYLKTLYEWTGVGSNNTFLVIVGSLSIGVLTLAAAVSIITVRMLAIYGAQVGMELGSRLFSYYMFQPWLFHANENSSQHIHKILNECGRIYTGIIQPFMHLNAKMVLALLMAVTIFIYNPVAAIVGVFFFAGSYLFLYLVIKQRLSLYGKVISTALARRVKLLNEGFGGIKDAILLNKLSNFTTRFDAESCRVATAWSSTHVLSNLPRYAIEYLAFVGVIFLVLFLLSSNDRQMGEVLPALAIYALAGLKLLPAFQQVYTSTSYIRGNLSAFDVLRDDLIKSQVDNVSSEQLGDQESIVLHDRLNLNDIDFKYPGTEKLALINININITANTTVGFAGRSGGGKSTLVDILLGLLTPVSGSLLVDGQLINASNVQLWQRSISCVPQQIYLADTSIRLNVAFGVPEEKVDDERVFSALEKANLSEFVASLPEGVETTVGERGVQLSGGQRQRIGIARALYRDFDLIVLDEATSALDVISERGIMSSLKKLSGEKTIVLIAHRLSTLKCCDMIYLIDNGQVTDSGSFVELQNRNPLFFDTLESEENFSG